MNKVNFKNKPRQNRYTYACLTAHQQSGTIGTNYITIYVRTGAQRLLWHIIVANAGARFIYTYNISLMLYIYIGE